MNKSKGNHSKGRKLNKQFVLHVVSVLVQLFIVIGVLIVLCWLGKSVIDQYMEEEPESNRSTAAVLKESDEGKTTEEEITTEKEIYQGDYYLYVNLKLNAIVAYGYDEDGKEFPIRVINCTIGPEVKKGTYSILRQYPWVETDKDNWNQYNSQIDTGLWIQSVSYREKSKGTLVTHEYNLIKKANTIGTDIRMTAADAKWIYNNCKVGTKIKIGNEDTLPMKRSAFKRISVVYGWDPTDPSTKNPWNKAKNNTIAVYPDTVKVERGAKIQYLANVVAYDAKGNEITKKLTYKKIDTKEPGTYKVTYSYGKGKKKITATIKYKVQDTTPPEILPDLGEKSRLVYKVSTKNYNLEYLNSEKMRNRIREKLLSKLKATDLGEEMVLNSSNCTILFPEKLYAGKNVVEIQVTDAYGNTGSQIVYVYFREKKEQETEETTSEEKTTEKKTTEKKTTEKKTTPPKATITTKPTPKPTTTKPTTTKRTAPSATKPATKPADQTTSSGNSEGESEFVPEVSAGEVQNIDD